MAMYAKLKGRIVEKFGTQGKFAEAVGTTEQTVSAKVQGRVKFTTKDVVDWSNMLDISSNDVGSYFFDPILSRN